MTLNQIIFSFPSGTTVIPAHQAKEEIDKDWKESAVVNHMSFTNFQKLHDRVNTLPGIAYRALGEVDAGEGS